MIRYIIICIIIFILLLLVVVCKNMMFFKKEEDVNFFLLLDLKVRIVDKKIFYKDKCFKSFIVLIFSCKILFIFIKYEYR